MDDVIKKAAVLLEALPYIQNFYDKTIVIKYGGAAMTDPEISTRVLQDIVFMNYVGMRPILVHGGGPSVSNKMKEMGKKSKFVRGIRVTDEETMKIAEEEFIKINSALVREVTALGGSAMSLNGKEDHFIEVDKHPNIEGEDVGFVGIINKVSGNVLQKMLVGDIIPVIPPLGEGEEDGHAYNINADQVAAEIAAAIGALKLVLLTNVGGIMKDVHDPSTRISHTTLAEVQKLTQEGIIVGGMIPKVNACARALEGGVLKTHILDANIPHALLLEIFTDKGIGTEIVRNSV